MYESIKMISTKVIFAGCFHKHPRVAPFSLSVIISALVLSCQLKLSVAEDPYSEEIIKSSVANIDAEKYKTNQEIEELERLKLNTSQLLFYDLNLIDKPDLNATTDESINQYDHELLKNDLVKITNDQDQIVDQRGHELVAFNLLASNRVGLFRLIPDTRRKECKKFDEHSRTNITLRASIIICHYNEAPSTLLRTIYSILKRSPRKLIEEIIVIDDFSQEEFASSKYESHFDLEYIKFIRTEKREGLIRARLVGSRMSKGDVLVFLDSHVEANINWLEPLLEVIQLDHTTVASPMIDLICANKMTYTSSPMVRGGFKWNLNFRWDSVPSDMLRTNEDFVKPINTPSIAGGLYAIHREFFLHLGEYDEGMDLWGGENIEISLRVWMCGGRLVILPCSRFGHIFRTTRPYGPEPGTTDTLLTNSHRSALVWLDEYMEQFYNQLPAARDLKPDVRSRLELRHKIGRHNFSWFLDNVYPDLKKEMVDLGTETSRVNSSHEEF